MSNGKIETPCFVVDTSKVKYHYTKWNEAFLRHNRDDIIAYSIKANYDHEIIRELNRLGSWFEVCTRHEYEMLIFESINPERIIVNGVICKSEDFDRYASNGSIVILDSERAIQIAISSKYNCRIGIRCNIDRIKTDAEMYRSIFSRFGVFDVKKSISQIRKAPHLHLVLLQAHLSGNSRDPIVYRQILSELVNIIKENDLNEVELIDVGGGYKVADDFWDEDDYVDALISEIREKKSEHLRIVIEPGNSLVRDSACYLTRIIEIKESANRRYCIADGSKLQIPYLHNGHLSDFDLRGNTTQIVRETQYIVGCTCKESDVFTVITNHHGLEVGAVLVINNVGAYTVNEISSFLLESPRIYYGQKDKFISTL